MARFQRPRLPDDTPKGLRSALDKAFDQIAAQFDGLTAVPGDNSVSVTTYRMSAWETKRVSPPAAGMGIVLPPPAPENRGASCWIFLEKPEGQLRVFASPRIGADGAAIATTVNGGEVAIYTEEGLVTLVSNGMNRWQSTSQLPVGSVGGAALDAQYIVGAAHASLTAERVAIDTDLIDVDLSNPGFVRWLHVDFPEGSFLAANEDQATANQQPQHVDLSFFAEGGLTYEKSVNKPTAKFPTGQGSFDNIQTVATEQASISVTLPAAFDVITNPTGQKVGDRLELLVFFDNVTAGLNIITTPAGWTLVARAEGATTCCAVYEKYLTAAIDAGPVVVSSTLGQVGVWIVRVRNKRGTHPTLPSRGVGKTDTVGATTTNLPTLIPEDGTANWLVSYAVGFDGDVTITSTPDSFTNSSASLVSGTSALDGTLAYGEASQFQALVIHPENAALGSGNGLAHGSIARAALVWATPPVAAGTFSTDAAPNPLAQSVSSNLFDHVRPNRSNPLGALMGVGLAESVAIANGPSPTVSSTLSLPFTVAATTHSLPFPPAVAQQGVMLTIRAALNRTLTLPLPGWTAISDSAAGALNAASRMWTFYRIVGAADSRSPITLTFSGTTAIHCQYDIIDDPNPNTAPVFSEVLNTVASATMTVPPLTPGFGVGNTLWMYKSLLSTEDSTNLSHPLPDGQSSFEFTGGGTFDMEGNSSRQSSRTATLTPAAQTWTTNNTGVAVLVAWPAGAYVVIDVSGVPLTALAAQAPDTFVGNITTGSAIPVAVPLADVDSVSVVYDATSHTFQRGAYQGAIVAAQNSNSTVFAGIRDNNAATTDRTNLNFVSSTSVTAVSADDAANDEIELTFQRAALTGAITAAQNSNATAFGTLAADTFFGNFTAGVAVPAALAGATVAGAGLTYTTGGILAVGAGTGITVNANDIAVSATWAQVLANSNNSGAFNPHIDTGQFIGFGAEGSLPASGDIRASGTLAVVSGGNLSMSIGAGTGDVALSAGSVSGNSTISAGSTSGAVTVTCGGDITLNATGSGARITTGAGYVVSGSGALSIAIASTEVGYICDVGVVPARGMVKEDTGNWAIGYAAVNVITSNATATNATTNLSLGSFTIPANTLRVGSVYKVTGYYVYTHTAAATPTLTLELLLAGVVVETVVCTPIATATDFSGRIEAWVTVRTVGAAGTAMTCIRHDTNVADPTVAQHSEGSTGTGTTAINTTVAVALTARIRMTTAVASNTLTVTQGFIERPA